MNRRLVAAVGVVVTSATAAPSPAQRPPLNVVMQQKAENAERLLRPVVLGDFAEIERLAGRFGYLTSTEIASWQSQPNSDYSRRASEFLEAIEDLGRAADARDANASARAYAALVASCVHCHQLVGQKPPAALTPPAPVINPKAPSD